MGINRGKIEKYEVKILVIFGAFAIVLAIPATLLFALDMDGPEFYWANSGNIFTDWSVYYLDFLPACFILSVLWLTNKLTFYNASKFFVFFFLSFWFFYDWAWWFIVILNDFSQFTWYMPFYFDIIIEGPPMWFFLMMSILGIVMSVLLLKMRDRWRSLFPFILYLIYVYALGGITEVIEIDTFFYWLWSIAFIPLIAVSFAIAFGPDDHFKSWNVLRF